MRRLALLSSLILVSACGTDFRQSFAGLGESCAGFGYVAGTAEFAGCVERGTTRWPDAERPALVRSRPEDDRMECTTVYFPHGVPHTTCR